MTKHRLPVPTSALLWIIWQDAVSGEQHMEDGDARAIALASNTPLGWIIDENESRVIVVNSLSTTGETKYIAIPTGWITARIPVQSKRTSSRKEGISNALNPIVAQRLHRQAPEDHP